MTGTGGVESPRVAVVLMAKEPRPGEVKTRLQPTLDATQAAALYEAFLADLAERVAALSRVERVLAVWPPRLDAPWLDPYRTRFRLVAQRGSGLGARMRAVMSDLLAERRGSVLMVGTDVPTLPSEILERGVTLLDRGCAAVLGPGSDGGYYAIGLGRWIPGLFDVAMSSPSVLSSTLELLERARARVELLPTWGDVDTPADLERLAEELADPASAARAPRTSAVMRRLAPS